MRCYYVERAAEFHAEIVAATPHLIWLTRLAKAEPGMTTRRELLQVGAAAAAVLAAQGLGGGFSRALAQQQIKEAELLDFPRLGNVTLLHIAGLHGQLQPVCLREPSVNLGFNEMRGVPPHLTGRDFLRHFDISAKS